MKVKDVLKQIEILKHALKLAQSSSEAQSIQWEISRLENVVSA